MVDTIAMAGKMPIWMKPFVSYPRWDCHDSNSCRKSESKEFVREGTCHLIGVPSPLYPPSLFVRFNEPYIQYFHLH